MALLRDEDVAQLTTIFSAALHGDVTLVHYTQHDSKLVVPGAVPCLTCGEAGELLDEVGGTSTHLTVEKHDFAAEREAAERDGIDKVPATIIVGPDGGRRVRYFGVPSGYEFASFVEDIIEAGEGQPDLEPTELDALASLERDVHIQVFTTASCPYCPAAVRTAHQLALASEHVVADMVSATEYPDLAQRYDVMAVPKIVINETQSFEGAVPADEFVRRVLQAVEEAA